MSFYLAALLACVLLWLFLKDTFVPERGCTYAQFQMFVERDEIVRADIQQNAQGLSGEITGILSHGGTVTVSVSDVTKAEEFLDKEEVDYYVTFEKESVFF